MYFLLDLIILFSLLMLSLSYGILYMVYSIFLLLNINNHLINYLDLLEVSLKDQSIILIKYGDINS